MDRRFGYAHIRVAASVVEEVTITLLNHAFDEDYVGDLADLFPLFLGFEDGLAAAPEEFARIVAVEDRNPGPVHKLVVGSVVEENNAPRGDDRRRARFGDAR